MNDRKHYIRYDKWSQEDPYRLLLSTKRSMLPESLKTKNQFFSRGREIIMINEDDNDNKLGNKWKIINILQLRRNCFQPTEARPVMMKRMPFCLYALLLLSLNKTARKNKGPEFVVEKVLRIFHPFWNVVFPVLILSLFKFISLSLVVSGNFLINIVKLKTAFLTRWRHDDDLPQLIEQSIWIYKKSI